MMYIPHLHCFYLYHVLAYLLSMAVIFVKCKSIWYDHFWARGEGFVTHGAQATTLILWRI